MTFPTTTLRAALPVAIASALTALAGCSTVDNVMNRDKIQYKTEGAAAKTKGLEVPPDLTQLSRESRFQMQGTSVSAASYQASAPATGQPATAAATSSATGVAPQAVGNVKFERAGNARFLVSSSAPEQVWPQIEAFWKEQGFQLIVDQPAAGVMETQWAENRAKLPQDIIRKTVGRVFDSIYSTDQRDKFNTRIERGAQGTEIYITHRGMKEVYSGTTVNDRTTTWQPMESDPQLEAAMLQRLMLKLGAKDEETARVAAEANSAGAAPAPVARARLITGEGGASALQVDEPFDRAWRRVGLALDRSGFTVEDRDRAQGIYFVRYVDPKSAGKEDGFFKRVFGLGKDSDNKPVRYRVSVKGAGDKTNVSVLNAQGAPDNGEAGKRITSLLVDDLK